MSRYRDKNSLPLNRVEDRRLGEQIARFLNDIEATPAQRAWFRPELFGMPVGLFKTARGEQL